MTVCPYHRYSLGINWKASKKCTFPLHVGKQQPQKGVTPLMSKTILNKFGCLQPVGSGICNGCKKKCNDLIPNTPEENECYNEYIDQVDQESTYESGYKLREHPIQQFENNKEDKSKQVCLKNIEEDCFDSTSEGTQFSQHLSQISNWSDTIDTSTLEVANEVIDLASRGKSSPLRGQLRTNIDEAKLSTIRYYKRKAEESVDSVLNLIAPGQSQELKKLIMPEMITSKTPTESDLTNSVLKLYEETTNSNLKSQILSVIARKMTKQELLRHIPDLTVYKIDQARLLSVTQGITIPEKVKQPRSRMDQVKLQHALDFFFDPCFVQIVSFGTRNINLDTGEHITIPDVVRTSCHSQIIQMYEVYCKDTAFEPLGRSTLFYILKACAASKRTNLHGLDNIAAEGVEGYQALHECTDKLKEINIISTEQHTELSNMLTASKVYMKTDFRLHVQESDMCADHCIKWSLSDPKDENFQSKCNHTHSLHCDRCQILKEIELKLKILIANFEDTDLKEEHTKRLSDATTQIYNWKSHIVRTVNQDRFRINMLESLETHQAMLVMDWAMKFLPLKYREKQTDWFGQRGKNWHVTVCIFKDQENAMKHKTFTHVLDSAKQDWFKIIKQTGIQIKHYCYSEPQAGKSYCDSKIAHMRTKMKTYVANGNNILSASDMKTALIFGIGVAGCQVSTVQIDLSKQKLVSHKIKKINSYNDVQVSEQGLVLRKAYGIGTGNLISFNEMAELSNNKLIEHRSGCIVHEAFKVPSTPAGNIKTVAKNEGNETVTCPENDTESLHQNGTNDALFFCPEVGCIRKFITYKGMENHVLCGKHSLQLEKKTTYDIIREQWASLCNHVVITCKTLSSPNSSVENTLNCEQMGWALQKGKKTIRFPVQVKKFLTDKFLDGETSGKKSNPVEVCEQMKSLRDSDGKRLFQVDEWLTVAQITSYFSRLAGKSLSVQTPVKQQEIDDDDLMAALSAIEEQELMDSINE
ncbi:unnamed protein product [Mytilus edulis]|uniref:C2H2-type domain-containing protein n=1 Tax=Mytilus edulis TaxID=6550 RepID=A0A8S3SD21_MYTED|nr:unnamed protein product [Mytilus edulis]